MILLRRSLFKVLIAVNKIIENYLKTKDYLILLKEGVLHSYAQIFFSNSKLLAYFLLFISFFDIGAGLSGVIAVVIGQLTAILFNFDLNLVRDGSYTFNSVLVGIAIGIFYEFNTSFLILLFISSIFVFLLSVSMASSFAKKNRPFLSIPFLIVIWIVILSANNFSALALKQKEVLSLAKFFPKLFTGTTAFLSHFPFANALYLYFRSLGAIFFQYNDLAGIVIAFGLLLHSRISFVLSVFGFLIGYFFYTYLEGDFSQLIYSYIGFNFILTAIALGGFFVVASRRSFLLLLLTIPIIALVIGGLQPVFNQFGLPLYSLPFNLVVLLFLSAMLVRTKSEGLQMVTYQQYSAEKNHYKFFNSKARFSKDTFFHISLPVMGEWTISQGYDGEETHKDDWQHALDFVILDDDNKSFKLPGYDIQDYYCYDLPVIAPESGYVVNVVDAVDDNKIGEVDLLNNWGNTIIIKHSEFLYSKLSHLKKNTIKVKIGQYINKGEVLAYTGSSGRSPEPHLHFQIQTTPYIGSKTIAHPISYYLTEEQGQFKFHEFEIPKKGQKVSNLKSTGLLKKAFAFIPGKTFSFNVKRGDNTTQVKWEVFVSSTNKTYIYCHSSGASAYYVNNGNLFYFTDFYGDRKTLLHDFYLGAHKIPMGYYPEISIQDKLMIETIFSPFQKAIHDFTAPFFHYFKAEYKFEFTSVDEKHNPTRIEFDTICSGKYLNKTLQTIHYKFVIENNKIKNFTINRKGITTQATCID